MKQVHSDDARRNLRAILNEVEHDGEHYEILRYQTPAAVIVPHEWYMQARQTIGEKADDR